MSIVGDVSLPAFSTSPDLLLRFDVEDMMEFVRYACRSTMRFWTL